jgi:hypothetical protein
LIVIILKVFLKVISVAMRKLEMEDKPEVDANVFRMELDWEKNDLIEELLKREDFVQTPAEDARPERKLSKALVLLSQSFDKKFSKMKK